ncbi:MAG TPA: TetR/AcrR family transcriptional regulator [Balneolaceae bacterium]|nr:TetR/AcrR family transcriptional regulator [Balneolaceae bacterium]
MADKKETEELIFEAAREVFQKYGYYGARMQDIADEAGINKSMLHYYFRSKDKLFQEVYQKEMGEFMPVIMKLLNSDQSLNEKIENIIDAYYSHWHSNPKLIPFIIIEMNLNPERFRKFIQNKHDFPTKFGKQLHQLVEEEKIMPIAPEQLLVSIVSLTLFPFVGKTMISSLFDLDDPGYEQFMEDRKKLLPTFILNAINYNE